MPDVYTFGIMKSEHEMQVTYQKELYQKLEEKDNLKRQLIEKCNLDAITIAIIFMSNSLGK